MKIYLFTLGLFLAGCTINIYDADIKPTYKASRCSNCVTNYSICPEILFEDNSWHGCTTESVKCVHDADYQDKVVCNAI